MSLTKRKLRPRLARFLTRQLDNPQVSDEHKALIAKVLDDPKKLDELSGQVHGLAKKEGAPDLPEADGNFGAAGDHPFLDWLKANWMTILTMILKLFGL